MKRNFFYLLLSIQQNSYIEKSGRTIYSFPPFMISTVGF